MKDANNKKSMISVDIADKDELCRSYMSFLEKGGIFLTTEHRYELGDSVFIRLKLPEEENPVPVACKVVWLKSMGNVKYGVGVQFLDEDDGVQNKIETYLSGLLTSDKITYTM